MLNIRRSNSSRLMENNKTIPAIIQNWSEIKSPSSLIQRRSCHSVVVFRNSLYVYGGHENSIGVLSDLMKYQDKDRGQSWVKMQSPEGNQIPTGRHSHTAITYNEKMYVFGGLTSPLTNNAELWVYDFLENIWQNWTYKMKGDSKKTNQMPKPIDSHKVQLYQSQMIIYGGFSQGKIMGSVWSLNLQSLEWTLLFDQENEILGKSCPHPRSNHSLNLLQSEASLLVFGGSNMDVKFNDLWKFNLKTLKWTEIEAINPPLPRSGHDAVVFRGMLTVFGGIKGITHELNDLIYYDSKINTWRVIWSDSQSSLAEKKRRESRNVPYTVLNNNAIDSSLNNSSNSAYKWNQLASRVKLSEGNKSKVQIKEQRFPPISRLVANVKSKQQKYRTALKSVDYYNNNIPEMVERQTLKRNNLGKSVIMNLFKLDNSGSSNSKSTHPNTPKYSPSMQNMTNSIMFSVSRCANTCASKARQITYDWSNSATVSGKRFETPKPRDGHSCTLLDEKFLLIFGGDQHMMTYNSVILVDLENIIRQTEENQNRQSSDSDSQKEESQNQRRVQDYFRINKTITIKNLKSKNNNFK